MNVFFAMLLMHLLYDFHWQGPYIAENKGRYVFLLAVHALTWAMLLCAVLWAFHLLAWWHFPFLFVTHFAIDRWKARQPSLPETFWLIYVDQALHLLTIGFVAVVA